MGPFSRVDLGVGGDVGGKNIQSLVTIARSEGPWQSIYMTLDCFPLATLVIAMTGGVMLCACLRSSLRAERSNLSVCKQRFFGSPRPLWGLAMTVFGLLPSRKSHFN